MSRWKLEPPEERFWAKVNKAGECWEWTASVGGGGYGKFAANGSTGRLMSAHRYSWTLANGEIPPGLCVLHRCDNRRCVRPDHLFIGTKKENTADMWRKGRGSRVGCGEQQPRGECHGMAKLTAADVLEIRRLSAEGWSLPQLCARFGIVSTGSMSGIVRGKKWRHLAYAQERGAPKFYAARIDITPRIK